MSLFASVKDLVSFFKFDAAKPKIDNFIFKLHYRFTTSFFLFASIFITAYSLVGNPINCHHGSTFEDPYVNQYCWTMDTYSYMHREKRKILADDDIRIPTRAHKYYQWVPLALFFHGLCFYLPHWLWKSVESGKIKLMSNDIRGTALIDSESRQKKREEVVSYIISTLNNHRKYAYMYFFCEILNLLVTILTMIIIDLIMGNTFMLHGLKLLNLIQEDPMERTMLEKEYLIDIFPRIAMCDVPKFGAGGKIETVNAICVLSLNPFNEKIYIFVWFWLVTLAIITFLGIAYSAAFLFSRDIRRLVITNRFKFDDKYEARELMKHIGVGDYLLLHLLGSNLSTSTFHQLLKDLNNRLLYSKGSGRSSHSDNLYPTYYKSKDALELDNIETKQPLIISEVKGNQELNEKTVIGA